MACLQENLLIAIVIVLKGLLARTQGLEIDDPKCEQENAIKVKCFNEQIEPITNGGTIRRHERILVEIEQIENACSFQIFEYNLVIIEPGSTIAQDDSDEVAAKGQKYTETSFEIQPYSIKNVGEITLKFFPMSSAKAKAANPATCSFTVDYSKVKAILLGGSETTYKPNKLTTIDASQSENTNEFKDKNTNLQFIWKCDVMEGQNSEFCTDNTLSQFAGKSKVTIPAGESRQEYIYKLAVTVQAANIPNPEKYQDVALQMVKFSELAAELHIQCVKNCVPKSERTLSSMDVILKTVCLNCKAFSQKVYYYWTVEDSNGTSFDYTKLRNTDRKGKTFYLNAGALKDNEVYKVKVEAMGDKAITLFAEITLNTKLPPPLKNCTIDPPSGTAFKTGFQAKCTYFPGDITFQIYSVKDGRAVLLTKTTTLQGKIFYLPAGAAVVINMTENASGYTQTATARVQVNEVLNLANKSSDKEKSKAVEDKMEDILDLAKTGNPEYALQGLSAVVGEYSKMPPDKKDLEFKMDQSAIKTITAINIDSPERAQQAADLLSQITERHQENPDPDLSLEGTAICQKASQIISANAHKFDNPGLRRAQLLENVKSLASCSQAGLGKNLKAVEDEPVVIFSPTTDYPLLELKEQIPEDYPDYTNDVKSSDNMAKFDEASTRMKTICFSNAIMIALTMVPEEDPIVNVKGSMSIASVRRRCEDVPNTRVENNAVNLFPSPDCQRSPVIDILMCVVYKNPYWWKDDIPMITNVVYTKFKKSESEDQDLERSTLDEDAPEDTKELGEFVDPFRITFKKNENISIEFTIHQANLPNSTIFVLDEDNFYDEVSTYRIFVFKNRGFTVRFHNMTDEDVYDIVLTEFEKPSFEYFKTHRKTIPKSNNSVDITEIRNYDTFWYLSVLTNKKMANSSSIQSYFISVTTVACYTWNETSKSWMFACNASHEALELITCYCTRGDVFTAYVSNNKVNLVEDVTLKFDLEVQSCWIIFIVTLLTFLLFNIILFFTSFEQENNILDRVFFVGDVPSYFKYAYIIIVTTGKKRYSGTTSNLTIKLYGSAANSLEHVLNYPDPELVMLQRNMETWFVIASENLLGDLNKIEIWFDSVGNNTKWYGSKIEVYDIQQDKSWEFKIEDWLDVMLDEHDVFVFTPKQYIPVDFSKETKKNIVRKVIRSFFGKAANEINLWNLRLKDPLLLLKERIIIIFSTIITMLLIIMMVYNIPKFNASDSIDENKFELHYKLAWTPIVGATVSYLIHFPFVHLIKKGKFKTVNLERKSSMSFLDVTENVATLSWVFISALTFICLTLLTCWGLWVPADTSLLWLVSVVLGMFFNALVLQNISCILYGYWLKLPAKIESFARTVERMAQFIELQRTWIYKRFGWLSLRPYLQHLYNRLDFVTLKERIKSEEVKIKVVQILEDLFMITGYVALLYLVLLLDREPMAVYSHKAIENLVTGKLIRSKMEIETISDIADYLNQALIPSIQSLQWYGKFVQDNPGMTKDFSNKYLGIMRIRQQRTKEVPCVVPEIMKFLNMTCLPEFSEQKEFQDFSREWKPASEFINITIERMGNIWKYSNSSLTGSTAYLGKLTVYPGGGYISTLGRTLKNSLINLKYLQEYKWLDLRTRAISVDFLTYNPNINLFNTVQVVFEISAAGSIVSKTEIQTRKLLMVDNEQVFTKSVVNFCFALILAGLFIRIIYKLVKKGRQFFYDLWSLFDVGIVILSVVSISLYYARLSSIRIYINDLTRAKNNEFVNYFHLFKTDNVLTSLTAILVFISTFRLWKLLKFMVIIQIAEKTLKDAAVPLLVCLVYQLIYIIAFSICGTFFFGADSKDFMDFSSTLITLIRLSINLFSNFNMDAITKHPLGIPYFSFYAVFSLFFTTVFIAIITLYYGDSKDFYATNEKGFVKKFVQEKWTYYKALLKVRIKNLRGGADNQPDERVIKPKLGDRYENCMTIPNSRIQAMALVTMCVLRNEKRGIKMAEKDFELMSKTIKALFGEESPEKEIFFVTGDSQHIDLVDNRKLEQIAAICEQLIIESKNIRRISRKVEKSVFENRMQRVNTLIENINIITRILENVHIEI